MNPYAPPGAQHPQGQWGQEAPQQWQWGPRFASLSTLTILTCIAIAIECVASLVLDGVQLAFASELGMEEPPLGPVLLQLCSALGMLGALVAAGVCYLMLIHRAAKNLRAFGRQGLEYTPGWVVGWFFVPFANLVRVPRVMMELWRGSDPATDGYSWRASASTPLIGVWWALWVIGNAISNVSARIDVPSSSASVGLVAGGFNLLAGVACILLILQLDKRQAATAAALRLG